MSIADQVLVFFSHIEKPGQAEYEALRAELQKLDADLPDLQPLGTDGLTLSQEFALLCSETGRNFGRRTGLSIKAAAAESARDERAKAGKP